MSKKQREMQPHWRPNFRIAGTLPDIKVIRTDFLINAFAVTAALVMLFVLGQREFRAYVLKNSVEDTERRIRLAEADNNVYLKDSEAFRAAAQRVVELDTFYDVPVLPHRLIVQLVDLKPEDLIFKRIAVSEQVVKEGPNSEVCYRITMSGEVRELTTLDEFKGKLSESKLLNIEGFTSSVDESLESRDPQTGIFPYRLTVVLSPVKPAAPAPEGAAAS